MSSDEETKRTVRIDAAEQTLLRSELHTTRERIHVMERRLHDIEMAQHIGVIRADGQGISISDMRGEISGMNGRIDRMIETLAGLTEP